MLEEFRIEDLFTALKRRLLRDVVSEAQFGMGASCRLRFNARNDTYHAENSILFAIRSGAGLIRRGKGDDVESIANCLS